MKTLDDYNTPTESRAWQVFLIVLFLMGLSYCTYKLIAYEQTGYFYSTKPFETITELKDVEIGSPADKAGLKDGDKLVSIDDLNFDSAGCSGRAMTMGELKHLHRLMKIGATLTVTVCRKNLSDTPGPEYEIISHHLTIASKPLSKRADAIADFLAFNFFAFFVLLYLGRKSSTLPKRLVCLSSIIFLFGYYGGVINYSIAIIVIERLSVMVFPIWLHIILIWPSTHPIKKKIPSLPYWVYGYVLLCMFLNVYFLFAKDNLKSMGAATAAVLPVITANLILGVHQYRTSNDRQRQQIKWLYLLAIISTLFMIILLTWVLVYASTPEKPPWMESINYWSEMIWIIFIKLFLLSISLAVVMAFTGYRLDIVQGAVVKSLKYSIMVVLTGTVMAFMAGGLALVAQRWGAITEPWAIIGITLLAVLFIAPFVVFVGRWLDRRLQGPLLKLREFKDHFDEFILKELDVGKLVNYLIESIQSIMECKPIFVFLRGGGNVDWRLAAFVNLSLVETERLSTGPPSALTDYIGDKPEPTNKLRLISASGISMQTQIDTDLIDAFDYMNTDVVVPIMTREDIQGIMCLGPKSKKRVYSPDELTVLGTIATKVGMGLTNALTYETVKQQVETKTRELEASNRQLKKLDQMKDDFLSMVSHDLRTPMTSIKGYASVLADKMGKLDENRQKKYLGIIERETDRLTRLIDDLLDLQRFEEGRMTLEFERFDLVELLEESFNAFQGATFAKEIKFEKEFAASGAVINGDRDRLSQVAANLLSNAIKFTPEGGTITVSTEKVSSGGKEQIKVSVADTGPGIPEDQKDKIFDKFRQVEGKTGRKQKGSGLGLALVRGIIEHHGGEVGVESQLGEGSTFYFTLHLS